MKNSQFFVSVVAREDTVIMARTGMGTSAVKVTKGNMEACLPFDIKILSGVAMMLENIGDANIKGRVSIIVPEKVFPRVLQAYKLIHQKEDMIENMLLPWMKESPFKVSWFEAIRNFAFGYYKAEMHGAQINWVNGRTLAMWKLENATDLNEGDVLLFNRGVSDYGAICNEYPLNGAQRVHVVQKDGETSYYVWRELKRNYYGEAMGLSNMALEKARKLMREAKGYLPAYEQA